MPTNFSIPGLMEMQSPVSDALEPIVNLEPHVSSNTNWIGIASLGPILINGESPPYTATRITMRFYDRFTGDCLTFDSEPDADGTIDIADAATWEFVIPEQPLPLAPGLWDWEIKVTNSQPSTSRLYKGTIIVRP